MRVYHLLPTEFGISNIALSRIKVSRYDDLNDPFELLSGKLDDKQLRKATSELKKNFTETKGLVCFSKNWENPVLWSHYADKHHGMALGFDIPDKYASEINYSSDRIPVKYVQNDPNKGVDPNYVGEITCTKYKHWEYENEVRLHLSVDECLKEGNLLFSPFSESLILREVILGHSCTVDIEAVRNLAHKLGNDIEIKKARLAFNSFRVVTDQRFTSPLETA